MDQAPANNDRLIDLLLEWEMKRERGEDVQAEVLCANDPELLEDFKRMVPTLVPWERSPLRPVIEDTGASSALVPDLAERREPVDCLAHIERLEIHACGGLGIVYKAWHAGLGCFVAVKFLKKHLVADQQFRTRFLSEAQITARLEHPGIVPVYGIGQDAAGVPFYVMRFIAGPTLEETIRAFHETQWIDAGERNKAFRELIGQFVAASAAVAYAHGNGVIHCDLKPTNIVVGVLGQIVVLDWGLAGSAATRAESQSPEEQAPGEETAATPAAGSKAAMGTVGYMSPEQSAGDWDRVDARSDVYSLGVTLRLLLSGKPALSTRSGPGATTALPRTSPSARRRRPHRIPRSLSAICRKAMNNHREDRYPTAFELVDDLKNWLADEPITALPDRWHNRWARKARRHRVAAVVGLVALVLVASASLFAAATTRIAQSGERRARKRAEARLELAVDAIAKFNQVVRDNVEIQQRPELKPLRNKLLEGPLEFCQQLHEDLKSGVDTGDDAQRRLGRATVELATIAAAVGPIRLAIDHFEESIVVFSTLLERHPSDRDARLRLAEAEAGLGVLLHAEAKDENARVHLDRAMNVYQRLVNENPLDTISQGHLAQTLDKLGLVEFTRDPKCAGVYFSQAIAIERKLLHTPAPSAISREAELAGSLGHLGKLHRAQNRRGEAESCYKEAIAVFDSVLKDHPGAVDVRFNLAVTYYNLGNLYIQMQREEALASLERSRDLIVEVVRDFPSTTVYQAQLAMTLGQMAILQRFRHQVAEARACFLQVREIQEKLSQESPSVLKHQEDMVVTLVYLGLCDKDLRRTEALVEWSRSTLALACDLVRQHPENAGLRENLARYCAVMAEACNELNRPEVARTTLIWAADQLRDLMARRPEREFPPVLLISTLDALAESCTLMNGPLDQSRPIAQELSALRAPSAEVLYRAARGMAWCALCERSAARGKFARGGSCQDRFCDQAMKMLAESARRGFKDNRRLTTDAAFALLRSREDFRRLVADLAFPSDPFAR